MEFLKKHYEKIILSVVLLGLAVAVLIMLMQIEKEKASLIEKQKGIQQNEKPYRPMDMTLLEATAARAKKPTTVILSGPHNTVNPVLWQERPDGSRIKVVTGTEVGPGAVVVTAITPLKLIIALESVSGSSFNVSVTREDQLDVRGRPIRPVKRYVSTNSPKSDFFTLKSVKGTPEAPVLEMELTDRLDPDKATFTIALEKPFNRIEAYAADLRYDVENLTFNNLRDGNTIEFGGEQYSVEIQSDAVILSSKSSTKRTTLKLK